MLYEKLMFGQLYRDVYEIYCTLSKVKPKNLTFKDLATYTHTDPRPLKSILTKIENFARRIDCDLPPLVFRDPSRPKYYLVNWDDSYPSVEEFRYSMIIDQSQPFRMLKYILTSETPDVSEYLTISFVSSSTLKREASDLQRFLKKYKMKLSFEHMKLNSNSEQKLRLTLFTIIWLATRGNYWVLTIDKEKIEPIVDKLLPLFPNQDNSLLRRQLEIIVGIQYERLTKGFRVDNNPRLMKVVEMIPGFNPSLLSPLYSISDDSVLKQEAGFLYGLPFMTQTFEISHIDAAYDHLNFFKNIDSICEKISSDFVDYFEKIVLKESLPHEEKILLKANLTQIAFSYYIMNENFVTINSYIYDEKSTDEAYLFLDNQLSEFLEDCEFELKYTELTHLFTYIKNSWLQIICPIYANYSKNNRVKIGLFMEQQAAQIERVKFFIGSLRFVDLELFRNENAKHYDLVITTSEIVKQDYPHLNYFDWDTAHSDKTITDLYPILTNLYYKKPSTLKFV